MRLQVGVSGLTQRAPASLGQPFTRCARMCRVGKHTGPSGEGRPGVPSSTRRLLPLALGLTLTVVAWGFLVWLAIDFGAQARSGSPISWVFLLIATLGATGALFLGLILGNKVLLALRGQTPDPRPPRAARGVAGKRAAR